MTAGRRPVLVAGASGFVGRALVGALVEAGETVRALARGPMPFAHGSAVQAHAVDVGDFRATVQALDGVGTAWYLVHALDDVRFRRRDRENAARFGAAARVAGVEQIVYLGALGEADGDRTPHVTSRREVADALRGAGVAVCELRAAVVIGRGSAVVELFRRLAERSPVLVAPKGSERWVQPVALVDVIRALMAPLLDGRWQGGTFEIGGDEVLSWQALMQRCLDVSQSHRRLVSMPVATPRLSGLWMRVFGGMSWSMGTQFIRNLAHDAVVRDERGREWLGGEWVSLDVALQVALQVALDGDGWHEG